MNPTVQMVRTCVKRIIVATLNDSLSSVHVGTVFTEG